MGLQVGFGSRGQFIFYPFSHQKIILTPGQKMARVGDKAVALKYPPVEIGGTMVIAFSDLLAAFEEWDRQRHEPPFINHVTVIYSIHDYHR